MTDAIAEFVQRIFGDNVILATIVIALFPLVELKGAIPFAMDPGFWGARALVGWQAFLYAFLGSCLVVPVIALVFRPLYEWLRTKKFFRKIVDFIVGDVARRSDEFTADTAVVQATTRKRLWLKVLTIVLFVAFPVPLTGVWTGTCFAVLLGLNFWQTCGCVIFGNAICGVLVTFICAIFPGATNILLYIFLGIILLAIIMKVVLHCVRQKKATGE